MSADAVGTTITKPASCPRDSSPTATRRLRMAPPAVGDLGPPPCRSPSPPFPFPARLAPPTGQSEPSRILSSPSDCPGRYPSGDETCRRGRPQSPRDTCPVYRIPDGTERGGEGGGRADRSMIVATPGASGRPPARHVRSRVPAADPSSPRRRPEGIDRAIRRAPCV